MPMSRTTILWSSGFALLSIVLGSYALLSSVPDLTQPEPRLTPRQVGGDTKRPAQATPHTLRAPAATSPAFTLANDEPEVVPAFTSPQQTPATTTSDRPDHARRRRQTGAAPTATDTSTTTPGTVTVQQGRVSLHARDIPLHTVLRDLAAQTGITVSDRAQTHATPVTLALDDVGVEEALKQLLVAFDVLFLYRGDSAGVSALQAVWIHPPGQAPFPGDDENSAIVGALSPADPAARAHSYETMLARPDWLSPSVLRNALQDDAAQVRLRVLSQAVVANLPLPADVVERLALTDEDAEVRVAALAAISFHPDMDWQSLERIATQASRDDDAAVHSKAMELMAHVEAMQTNALVDADLLTSR